MIIYCWNGFSKRHNSTKQPPEAGRVQKTVHLKENTSLESPVFILEGGINCGITYVQYGENFYYVVDIVSIANNLVEIHCKKDVLATWKTYIEASNAYVVRAESEFDTLIEDREISQNLDFTIHSASSAIENIDTVTGCYILRVVGANGIKTFVLNNTKLQNVFSALFTNDDSSPLKQVADYFGTIINNALFNPLESILSLKWIPLSYNAVSAMGTLRTVYVGWATIPEEIGPTTRAMTAYDITGAFSISDVLPLTMPTDYYTDFRKFSNNWTKWTLYVPGVGTVPIDSTIIKGGLGYSYDIDFDTCTMTSYLWKDTSVISSYDCDLGYDIPMSQTNGQNILTTIGSVAVAEIVRGDEEDELNALKGVYNAARNTFANTPSVKGSASSRAKWIAHPNYVLTSRSYHTKDSPVFTRGLPLESNRTLNTLTGFIRCANASIDIPAVDTEKQEVNNYLNTGFYHE